MAKGKARSTQRRPKDDDDVEDALSDEHTIADSLTNVSLSVFGNDDFAGTYVCWFIWIETDLSSAA